MLRRPCKPPISICLMNLISEVILTDDCSQDRTVEIAHKVGLTVIEHKRNKGYGANQKSWFREALNRNPDFVVMVHPDHQYDPKLVTNFIEQLLMGEADAVFGSRMLGGHVLEGGMPMWKYVANICLTAVSNLVFKGYLTEIHSGFRAYSIGSIWKR